jgi:hypothetical protein
MEKAKEPCGPAPRKKQRNEVTVLSSTGTPTSQTTPGLPEIASLPVSLDEVLHQTLAYSKEIVEIAKDLEHNPGDETLIIRKNVLTAFINRHMKQIQDDVTSEHTH